MTKLDAGLITSLPASDPGSAAVWGSKRINPRPQFCLCLAWSGCPSNDDDDDFMSVAFLTALRSEDPNTKVAACFVNQDGKIVGLGYNKSPGHVYIPWNKIDENRDWLQSNYPYVLHAKMDAILNKTCKSLQDCTMYSLVLPYNECAKLIVESGIKKLVYYVNKISTGNNKKFRDASKILFDIANVIYEKFVPRQNETAIF